MSSLYTKLTPTKRYLFGYSQLWQAPDHILLLISSQFAEDYKRFAFADIQSIVITESPSRVVAQIVMILTAVAWMCLWFVINIAFFKWTFLITGALALIWPVVDIARGPRCRCYLYTSVSKELLAPVSRMGIARRFLSTVRPQIESVQGVLSPEQLATTETPPWQPPPPELVGAPGYLPEFLFVVFLIDAALIWASLQFPKVQEIPGVLVNLLLAEMMLIVVALGRRRGRDPRVIIYIVIVLAIAGLGYDLVTVGRQMFGWYLTTVEKARRSDRSTTLIALFPSSGSRAMIAYSWRAAAGVFGLAAAFYERRKPAGKPAGKQ
jgi:hypothetical protein